MNSPPLTTILDALTEAATRTSARAVARATQLTPTRVLQLIDEHRRGVGPRVFPPTQRKLSAWYKRHESGTQPEQPKLSRLERSELHDIAEHLKEILDPELTVLVGPHLVSAHDVTVAIRRLAQR